MPKELRQDEKRMIETFAIADTMDYTRYRHKCKETIARVNAITNIVLRYLDWKKNVIINSVTNMGYLTRSLRLQADRCGTQDIQVKILLCPCGNTYHVTENKKTITYDILSGKESSCEWSDDEI